VPTARKPLVVSRRTDATKMPLLRTEETKQSSPQMRHRAGEVSRAAHLLTRPIVLAWQLGHLYMGLDHILEDETYFFEPGPAKGEFLLGRRFRNEPGCSVEPTAALVL